MPTDALVHEPHPLPDTESCSSKRLRYSIFSAVAQRYTLRLAELMLAEAIGAD
jgi:hypothetical protein